MCDFNTEFQSFIDDMLNKVIGDLKEEDIKCARCRMYIKENDPKIREIVDRLPKENKKLMNKYESKIFNIMAT